MPHSPIARLNNVAAAIVCKPSGLSPRDAVYSSAILAASDALMGRYRVAGAAGVVPR